MVQSMTANSFTNDLYTMQQFNDHVIERLTQHLTIAVEMRLKKLMQMIATTLAQPGSKDQYAVTIVPIVDDFNRDLEIHLKPLLNEKIFASIDPIAWLHYTITPNMVETINENLTKIFSGRGFVLYGGRKDQLNFHFMNIDGIIKSVKGY